MTNSIRRYITKLMPICETELRKQSLQINFDPLTSNWEESQGKSMYLLMTAFGEACERRSAASERLSPMGIVPAAIGLLETNNLYGPWRTMSHDSFHTSSNGFVVNPAR